VIIFDTIFKLGVMGLFYKNQVKIGNSYSLAFIIDAVMVVNAEVVSFTAQKLL